MYFIIMIKWTLEGDNEHSLKKKLKNYMDKYTIKNKLSIYR